MREVTRWKILEAAVALFAEKGLSGTSTKDIAKEAGVSVGLMYHYYQTKEEMFSAIIEGASHEMKDLRKMLSPPHFESGIKTFVEEVVAEMQKGLSLSRWMVLLAQSTDFDRQLISELIKSVSAEQAQFFVASIQGLCRLQLTLKEEFRIPTVEQILFLLAENHQSGT